MVNDIASVSKGRETPVDVRPEWQRQIWDFYQRLIPYALIWVGWMVVTMLLLSTMGFRYEIKTSLALLMFGIMGIAFPMMLAFRRESQGKKL